MPNKDVHRPIGVAVGGAYACIRAGSHPWEHVAVEIIGGLAGGWLGAALPDWVDPPTCPNHRHYGHGVLTVAGTVAVTAEFILDLQHRLRYRADELAQNRIYLRDDFARLINWIEELLLRFLVGMLNGITAGYISHLALDAFTPSSLPIFVRGF